VKPIIGTQRKAMGFAALNPSYDCGDAQDGWRVSIVMIGTSPRLSGLILIDKAHGIDSSANQAFGDVLGHGRNQGHAAPQ
jgi:hypothetical protein